MAAVGEQLANRHNQALDYEQRTAADTATWLAETLNGSMRTSLEFSNDGQELRGEDGGALGPVFDDAIEEAQAIVKENPSLFFELRRRLIERGELSDMESMANGELLTDDGETANTIVVVSDFPPELMDTQTDVGGYNTRRRQTMLRIISLQEDGTIRLVTQSLDRSNRRGLEAIYQAMGRQARPGELLEQRMAFKLGADQQANLADGLTGAYDNALTDQYGDEWHAGIRQDATRLRVNTYDFIARSQQDLIEWFTKEKLADPIGAEKLRYKVAATAKARYERYVTGQSRPDSVLGDVKPETLISPDQIIAARQNLQQELERESRRAALRGDTFSGCGASVSAEAEEEGDFSIGGRLKWAGGYGNWSGYGSDQYGKLKFDCPNGHQNVRERNKFIDTCRTCGVSVKC